MGFQLYWQDKGILEP